MLISNLMQSASLRLSQRGLPVTTDQVSVRPQSRTNIASALTGTCMTAMMPILLVVPIPEAPRMMDRDGGKKGRMMKGREENVGVFGLPQAQAIKGGSSAAGVCVRALKQLMRIFNICWVHSVLKVIHHFTDSVLASWACWLCKMHAFRPEDEFRKVCLVEGKYSKRNGAPVFNQDLKPAQIWKLQMVHLGSSSSIPFENSTCNWISFVNLWEVILTLNVYRLL